MTARSRACVRAVVPPRPIRNARVIDLMTLNSDSDSKAKSDDSDSSHDSKSLDSG